MNYFTCSDGSKVSQETIRQRRSKAYRAKYAGEPHPCCEGCGGRAQGSSHTISQVDCKNLHHTEWIWALWNFWAACYSCNSRWESNDTTLLNYDECMEVLRARDPEGYHKRLI